MKLTPWNKSNLGKIRGRQGYLHEILDEFAYSGSDCVRVEEWPHKSASHCTTSLNVAIKRYNKHGIRAVTRDGEVYLIKTK